MNPLHRAARRNHAARLDAIEEQQEATRLVLNAILRAVADEVDRRAPAPSGPPKLTVIGRE